MRNATKTMVSSLGVVMGLAGVEHGIGEILQGSTAPSGLLFPSWPESAFFRSVGGEPAMTVIPNLLVTGILAILLSIPFAVWAILFVQKKNGGQVLMLLSAGMLLSGAGIFPPVIGFVLGLLATRINAPSTGWGAHLSPGLRRLLGKVWPWAFGVCVLAWLLLFPGINILGYFFGVNDPKYVVFLILFALGSLLITILAGFGKDQNYLTQRNEVR
jgi:hypothetical protein